MVPPEKKERSRSACWLSRDTGTLGHGKAPPSPPPSPSPAAYSSAAWLGTAPGKASQKAACGRNQDLPQRAGQNLLSPGTQGPSRGQLAYRAPEKKKGKATAACLQLPGMVQERLGSSSPFLAPLRHSTDDAGRKRGHHTLPQHCPSAANPARIISLHRAELGEPKRS